MTSKTTDKELDELEQVVETPRKKKQRGGAKEGTRLAPSVLTDNNLTPQQEAYCRGRAMGMSKTEAVAMAGVERPAYGTEWEKLPAVRRRIAELTEMVTENSILKNGLDRGWVISRLMTVVERCMEAEPVLDREGSPTGEYKFDSSGANRALELLGKTMRMFEAKEAGKQDEYANLSDDEIARIASELATQTGLAGLIAGAETAARSQQVIEVQAIPKAD